MGRGAGRIRGVKSWLPVVLLVLVSGCSTTAGTTPETTSGSPADHETADHETAGHSHTGADGTHISLPVGDGTRDYEVGYRLTDVRLPGHAGRPGDLSFSLLDYEGQPLRDFIVEQTKDLHLYVVSDDLATFRHVHPEQAEDGRWSGRVTLPTAGGYRVITEFVARDAGGDGDHVILGAHARLGAGPSATPPADAPGQAAGVITADIEGRLLAAPAGEMTVTLRDSDGRPVKLGTYLGSYAHLTGFDKDSGGLVHLHPIGTPRTAPDGTRLTFHTAFPAPGAYRFFVQARVDGFLHTLPVDAEVSGPRTPGS